jgi:hypothetical protein
VTSFPDRRLRTPFRGARLTAPVLLTASGKPQ